MARTAKSPGHRSMRRPPLDPTLHDTVVASAFGICRRCGNQSDALQVHHRKLRARGGTDDVGNLIAVCPDCHHWIHMHPAESTAEGFMVASWDDPAGIAFLQHGTDWILP